MCLDNAEEIIINDIGEFKFFLSELYNYCPNLRIIVTSRMPIGLLEDSISPKYFFVK